MQLILVLSWINYPSETASTIGQCGITHHDAAPVVGSSLDLLVSGKGIHAGPKS